MEKDLRAVLKRKLPELKQFFARNENVLGAWLFGSQVGSGATAHSDIDLAVLFERRMTWNQQMGFEVAVCEILGTDDVDVIDLHRVNLRLRIRALSGNLLYERDSVMVSDFIERTMRAYPDYAYYQDRFNQDYFEGMRQDYARFRPPANPRAPEDHRKQSKATRRREKTRKK
jgi:predicted nucleotidyltransferase